MPKGLVQQPTPDICSTCSLLSYSQSIDEWIMQMGYIHTIQFYSTVKRNEIMKIASKWRELEHIRY